MAEIVKIKKDGVIQYPITKPECVIDENGKNVLQLIKENGGGGYDDTEIKEELTELSEEVSGLKEQVDNLPTAESSVFEAKYGVTTFAEIVEARNKGKEVVCKYDDKIARVTLFSDSMLVFETTFGTLVHRFVCYSDNNWDSVDFDNTHKLETLANGNAQITIAGKTAEVATPQYVENAIQQSDSLVSDWNAQEGEAGYIKNKPYEIFKSKIEKVDDNTLRVLTEDEYTEEASIAQYLYWNGTTHPLNKEDITIGSGRDILTITYDDGYYFISHNRWDIETLLYDYEEGYWNVFYVVNGIDGIYLTNNVVKTLPQNLSDEAKNQVKENLGLGEVATKQELTELSAEIGLRNVGAEDTDESVDEPEIPTPSASNEWKCVYDGRMEEGKSSIIYTTYADGTPLKAREAIIEVVNDIKAAADITGYVRIQSTLNKNKCSFGIITYESASVGDGKIMVQDVRIETSEHFFTKAYIAKDMKNAIAHSSVVGEEIGHNPQIFEDIVSIELASNLLLTEAAPLIKIYAR